MISTRRPSTLERADYGNATPPVLAGAAVPRVDLLTAARREAARRALYSRFSRGGVLEKEDKATEAQAGPGMQADGAEMETAANARTKQKKTKKRKHTELAADPALERAAAPTESARKRRQ